MACQSGMEILRKKWFECANLKTLKMHEELSASFESCEKALSHRCLCLTPARKYRRTIKSDEDKEKSSETASWREQRAFREMTDALRRVRNSRSEKSGVRRHDHRATSVNSSVCSEAENEMVAGNSGMSTCLGWNKKRHEVHSNRDTVAWCLG